MRLALSLILAASAFAQLTPVIPSSAVQGASNLTTPGSVPYVSASGVLSQDSVFFWDSTNNWLGIGTGSPSYALHVRSATSQRIENETTDTVGVGFWTKNSSQEYFAGLFYDTAGAYQIVDVTNGLVRMTITGSTGNALFGSSTDGGFKLDAAKSGSLGTLRAYDQTASTGVTLAEVRAGAGQSGSDLLRITNNSGTKQVWVDSSYAQHGNTYYTLQHTSQPILIRSGAAIAWASTANSDSGVYDVGLSRTATSLLTVGNSVAGNVNGSIQAEWHLFAGVATVASATTIAPTKSVIRVTGSTTIQTITVPSVFQSYTGAQLVIIPDTGATWATNTSGNIAVASTAVVAKPLIMIYDANVSKWYPSY